MSNNNEHPNIDYAKLTADLNIDLTNADLTYDVFATSMKELGCSNAY